MKLSKVSRCTELFYLSTWVRRCGYCTCGNGFPYLHEFGERHGGVVALDVRKPSTALCPFQGETG
jgi:hypothetical protein